MMTIQMKYDLEANARQIKGKAASTQPQSKDFLFLTTIDLIQ